MTATDELREFARTHQPYKSELYNAQCADEITAIADRIDAEYEKSIRELNSLAEASVLLPKDRDGEYIRVGDKVICGVGVWTVTGLELVGERWNVRCTIYNESGGSGTALYSPISLRHYREPTVEDVLREFALACEDAGNAGPEVERIATEYAAKLQLKGDE